ncbi:hypothetical protein KUV85_14375 [Nocardioides panacisoli]|uniref:hypothetical protein n=1 Tax=Nocardioides panacisoli TaxID=627624 RepID=UPI001C62FB72|nr:hypothetical protein [Nocardioides panacisoli]QYJ03503.1 hypothetical protein KUV85_14375 [Nocardioides panacisoli]
MDTASATHHRLAPAVVARFVGAYLVVFAVVVLAATAIAYAAELNLDLLVLVLVIGLLGLIGMSWWLRSRVVVVRLTADGYRVRMVRGVGVAEARWAEVEDAVPTTPHGIECVTLRLKDGRTTTIPVALLAADKDDFARDVRSHLSRSRR